MLYYTAQNSILNQVPKEIKDTTISGMSSMHRVWNCKKDKGIGTAYGIFGGKDLKRFRYTTRSYAIKNKHTTMCASAKFIVIGMIYLLILIVA